REPAKHVEGNQPPLPHDMSVSRGVDGPTHTIFRLTGCACGCNPRLKKWFRLLQPAPSPRGPYPTRGGCASNPHSSRRVEETIMAHLTRRSMLRGSVALGATRLVDVPHIARAAATTASVWFSQGFVQDEDVAFRKAVSDYEKASGNKIELSITPFAP